MDQSNLPNSDPTILLLNEIEILVAQTRLMELNLKQAQATAANNANRNEQQHQAELAALRALLVEKEQSLSQLVASIVVPDPRLDERVQEIEAELADKQRVIEDRQAELTAARGEITTLRDRIGDLESTNQRTLTAATAADEQSKQLQAELNALGQELEINRRDFDDQLLSSRQVETGLREQLQQLQSQVAEKQLWTENADTELAAAQSEIFALQQRIDEIHASRRQLEADAAGELEKTRARFEAEIAELQATLATQAHERQQSQTALAEIESRLKCETIDLHDQLEAKQLELTARDNDWRQAQAEIVILQQQVIDLNAKIEQAEIRNAEFATLRQTFENEIAELAHEVSVKERELIQRYEAVSAVELALHGRIQVLQQELGHSRQELSIGQSELENQRAEIVALNDKIAELERSRAEAESAGKRFVDETRQRVEDELNRLHANLAQKDHALKEQENAQRNLAEQFNSEILQLRQQLDQEQNSLQSTNTELARLREELAAQQQRNGELEKARQEAVDNWQRGGVIQSELQSRLQAKNDAFDAAQANSTELRAQLENRITKLHSELAQRQSVIDSRGLEITELTNQSRQLLAQLGELESAQLQAAQRIEESTQSHAEHQAELVNLHDNYQIKIAALEDEIAQARQAAVNAAQAGANELRAPLEIKINDLQLELAQKQLLVDSRSAEIIDLKANLQQSMAQLTELEQLRQQVAVLTQATEQGRAAHHADLANLNVQHEQRFSALESELTPARERAIELENQIQEIATRNRQLTTDLQVRHQQMEAAVIENVALHDRLRELEGQRDDQRLQVQGLERSRIALEAELTGLRQELQQKNWALAQQQAAVDNLALVHKEQLQKLDARLTEQQLNGSVRDTELARLQSQAGSLQHRVEELESELRDAELTELNRIEQIRQDNLARVEELNALVNQKDGEIAERSSAQLNLERSLRREVDRLLHEIDERNGILQNRNDELVRVKADWDSTNERLRQWEAAAAQAQTNASSEVESLRTEYQAQLALLQAELSQKEWALEEGHAATNGMEQKFRLEIEALRKQLAEQPQVSERAADGFVMGNAELSTAQRERAAMLQQAVDDVRIDAQKGGADSQGRRWRTNFTWKRRWKA